MESKETYQTITAELRIEPESQLDRIEKKMDRILDLLESKVLSISTNSKTTNELILQDHIKKTYTLADTFVLNDAESFKDL